MYVPAGLIEEGGDSLRVAHYIYIGFNAPWDIIGDSGIQHQRPLTAGSKLHDYVHHFHIITIQLIH